MNRSQVSSAKHDKYQETGKQQAIELLSDSCTTLYMNEVS